MFAFEYSLSINCSYFIHNSVISIRIPVQWHVYTVWVCFCKQFLFSFSYWMAYKVRCYGYVKIPTTNHSQCGGHRTKKTLNCQSNKLSHHAMTFSCEKLTNKKCGFDLMNKKFRIKKEPMENSKLLIILHQKKKQLA